MQPSIVWRVILILFCLPVGSVLADDSSAPGGAELQIKDTDENDDDTPDIETETTVDDTQAKAGLKSDGDLRPIYDDIDVEGRDGRTLNDDVLGFRLRLPLTGALPNKSTSGPGLPVGALLTTATRSSYLKVPRRHATA